MKLPWDIKGPKLPEALEGLKSPKDVEGSKPSEDSELQKVSNLRRALHLKLEENANQMNQWMVGDVSF